MLTNTLQYRLRYPYNIHPQSRSSSRPCTGLLTMLCACPHRSTFRLIVHSPYLLLKKRDIQANIYPVTSGSCFAPLLSALNQCTSFLSWVRLIEVLIQLFDPLGIVLYVDYKRPPRLFYASAKRYVTFVYTRVRLTVSNSS